MNRLEVDGRVINYVITRKKVKNINMRLKEDGIVYISAGRFIKKKFIEEFITQKSGWIQRGQERLKKAKEMSVREFNNKEVIYFLGKELKLQLFSSKRERVDIENDYFKLYVKNINDINRKRTVFDKWQTEECKKVFADISAEVYEFFKVYGLKPPEIKVRKMKSRWGSCYPTRGLIVLNRSMIGAPRECIEYVVLHEYAHFIHPNHSTSFYSFVENLMPDYKERKEVLNNMKYC